MFAEPFELLRPEGFVLEIRILANGETTGVFVCRIVPSQRKAEGFFDGIFYGVELGWNNGLGLIGEYVGRIFEQGQNRPLYFIDRVCGEPLSDAAAGQ